jgi:hypothetical protein
MGKKRRLTNSDLIIKVGLLLAFFLSFLAKGDERFQKVAANHSRLMNVFVPPLV